MPLDSSHLDKLYFKIFWRSMSQIYLARCLSHRKVFSLINLDIFLEVFLMRKNLMHAALSLSGLMFIIIVIGSVVIVA